MALDITLLDINPQLEALATNIGLAEAVSRERLGPTIKLLSMRQREELLRTEPQLVASRHLLLACISVIEAWGLRVEGRESA